MEVWLEHRKDTEGPGAFCWQRWAFPKPPCQDRSRPAGEAVDRQSGLSDPAGLDLHGENHKGTEERTLGKGLGLLICMQGPPRREPPPPSGFEQKLTLLCSCLSQGQSPSRDRNKGGASPIQPPCARQALLRTGREEREGSKPAPLRLFQGTLPCQGNPKVFFPPGQGLPQPGESASQWSARLRGHSGLFPWSQGSGVRLTLWTRVRVSS